MLRQSYLCSTIRRHRSGCFDCPYCRKYGLRAFARDPPRETGNPKRAAVPAGNPNGKSKPMRRRRPRVSSRPAKSMMRAVASARVGRFSSLAKARPLGRRTVRPSQILSWPRVGAFAALQSTIRYESKADMALSYSIVCHLSGPVVALIDRTSVLSSCRSD